MKKKQGVIKSDKMKKTVVVEVVTRRPHPLYRKIVKKSKRYKADVGKFKLVVGDKVVMQETRPLSREKRWLVIEKIT